MKCKMTCHICGIPLISIVYICHTVAKHCTGRSWYPNCRILWKWSLVLSGKGISSLLIFQSKAGSALCHIDDDEDDIKTAVATVARRIWQECQPLKPNKWQYETRTTLPSSTPWLQWYLTVTPKEHITHIQWDHVGRSHGRKLLKIAYWMPVIREKMPSLRKLGYAFRVQSATCTLQMLCTTKYATPNSWLQNPLPLLHRNH